MVIFVASLIGNLLTCIVIYYDRTMHTATNYYLFNLAVSDLILTFGILLEVYEFVTDTYHFGNIVCKLHFFFVVLLWNNSILIMTTLAIERYIAIWYPLMFQSKPVWRRVMKVIFVVWVIAIAETLPELWSVSLIKTDKSSICYTVPTPYARLINGLLAIVTFVVPLMIMTFVYAMIAFKVNHPEKSNPDSMVFNHRENRKKVNKLIVALTLSFLVCWLPFFSLRVLFFACDVHQFAHLFQYLGIGHRIVYFNNWFSMVLNPILFSLMSTKFRNALKMLWKSKIRGQSNMLRV
ncbi:neuromedin-U receptor 2-like [Epargyreus clarus]|uniref:neuromedin-U receptor 2-like n=1 Tax=Epargyreus clarus TaxID=520877 RepID=UPI003C2B2E2B